MAEAKNIYEALSNFAKDCGVIKKQSRNDFFKSMYATLSDIKEVIDTPLANNGLVPTSRLKCTDQGTWVVETILTHVPTGEVLVSEFPVFGNKPQEVGSSITYARRYNIQALLDLVAEDDDGNSANGASTPQGTVQRATPAQIAKLKEMVLPDKYEAMLNFYGVKTFEELSYVQARKAIALKEAEKKGA